MCEHGLAGKEYQETELTTYKTISSVMMDICSHMIMHSNPCHVTV